ncbi:MAG: hypothetical protein HY747_08270 [Elusimicrobia bacterium]|nr:hypothetical protein [Elusimicrobiota bacterium]
MPNKELLFIHTWGFIGFVAVLVIGGILYEPKERVPYYLWAFALLIIMRSIFTLLTPLGLPKEAVSFKDYPIQFLAKYVDFRHTLFFSGHTAFPFMGFLLARRTWVKLACLGFTFLLAASVLMGRLHYSIDVAAAFFIAYGTYRMCWPIYRRVQSLIGFCLKAPIKRQADAVGGKSGF